MTTGKTKTQACIGLTTLLLLPRLAWTEEPPPQPYLVLVGISKYADPKIKPRRHAESDARALHDLLTSKAYLGADPRHVKLLLGSQASRANILQALRWAAGQARVNDPVYFAFLGNGGPLGELGDRRCYFAADSTFRNRDRDAVAAEDIGEALQNLKSERFVAFLDVDFKGCAGLTRLTDPELSLSPCQQLLGIGASPSPHNDDSNALPGRVVFLANRPPFVPLDLKDRGLFAAAVLEGLKGAADTDGGEPDGRVTVQELAGYLDKRLPGLAAEQGQSADKKNPRQLILAAHSNSFVLTANPTAMSRIKERLDKLEALLKSSKLPAGFAEEARELLQRMPRLQSQRTLRKDYQALVDGQISLDAFQTRRKALLEGMRCRELDAVRFARTIIEAAQLVKRDYVLEVNQGEMVGWGIEGLYRRLDEKVPEDIRTRLRKVKSLSEEELTQLVARVRKRLGKRDDLDKHKDIDLLLQAMLSRLDPDSEYIDSEHLQRFQTEPVGRPVGVGIEVRKEYVTDTLLALVSNKDCPAYRAGVRTGDLILRISQDTDPDGQPLPQAEEWSAKGHSQIDGVQKLLGRVLGAKIRLLVQRQGEVKALEFEMARNSVLVETVLGHKRDSRDEWEYLIDKDNKIGYVRLSRFSWNTQADLTRVMQQLTREGTKGVVLDLRFNPGRSFDSALKITDLFIRDGLIVRIQARNGEVAKFTGEIEGSLLNFPMVCLINGSSCRASEIMAAALQDHKRAWIIGERSCGKGSLQNIMPFDQGELKMTTALFYRPSGKSLNRFPLAGKDEKEWGVIPDKEINLSRKERADLADALRNVELCYPKGGQPKFAFRDRQLEEALIYLRKQIKQGGPGRSRKE